MEKRPIDVVTLDSESEDDDLQIVSENITNYGNYQTLGTTMEITPELQEKIRQSLAKCSGIPGKIKAIQIFATKNNNGNGTVRASYNLANGQGTQVINVSPDFKANFISKVQDAMKYDFGNKRKPAYSLVTNSEKPNIAKYLPPPISNDHKLSRDERPSSPSSPVILFSPIRKVKQSPIERENPPKKKIHQNLQLQNLTPINRPSANPQKNWNPPCRLSPILAKYNQSGLPQNSRLNSSPPHQHASPSWQELPLSPQILSISQLDNNLLKQFCQQSQYFGATTGHQHEISQTEINRNENLPLSEMITPESDLLMLGTKDNVFEYVSTNLSKRKKLNPGAFSPMKYYNACDDKERSTNFIETEKLTPVKCSLMKYASGDEEVSTNIGVNEKLNPIPFSKIKYASDDEEGSANVSETRKLNPVTMKYSSDDEEGFENSMLGVRSSPISSPEKLLNIFPNPKSEEKSVSKVKEFYCIDTMLEKETKQNKEKKNIDFKDIISQIEQKRNNDNERNLLELDTTQDANVMRQDKQWPDSGKEVGKIIQLGTNAKVLMSLKVDIECLKKNTAFDLSKQDETNKRKSGLKVNAEKEDSISNFTPLWTTIFPPSPISPTPPDWYGSTHLWQLDATEFVSVTGLCRNEAAAEMRRRVDAPKPLVRVLRPRPKKIDFGEDFVTE